MHVSWFEADAYARSTRQAPAHRGRVGEGGRLGRGERPVAPLPVGRRAPERPPRQPRPDRVRARAGRRVPRGRLSVRRAGHARRRLGVDGERLPPLPGLRGLPLPEYSEIFFDGAYKVLRGGSWATRPDVASTTFRNWDYPQRRQIFCRLPVRGMTGETLTEGAITIDSLPDGSALDSMAEEVREGLARDAEGAAAQVLLRRARLDPVRPHHASCPSTTPRAASARSSTGARR